MFKIVGVLVGFYAAYGLLTGEVYASGGRRLRCYRRDENALGYWGAIGAYAALVLMIFFLF